MYQKSNWNRYMSLRRWYILLILLIATSNFYEIGRAEETITQTTHDELHNKAMSLKEEGNTNAALEILKKIMDETGNKDELRYTDALIEQCMIMKDKNDPAWKLRAIEAAQKVKILFKANFSNSEYWLVYAKYSALVNKERHVGGAFNKAFFYKPNYVKGYILKGDLYSYLAKVSDRSITVSNTSITGETIETNDKTNFVYFNMGKSAKEAYEIALNSLSLDNKQKAYVFYRIGELELLIFSNKSEAVRNWKKVVEFDPDGIYGKISKKRLEIHE